MREAGRLINKIGECQDKKGHHFQVTTSHQQTTHCPANDAISDEVIPTLFKTQDPYWTHYKLQAGRDKAT